MKKTELAECIVYSAAGACTATVVTYLTADKFGKLDMVKNTHNKHEKNLYNVVGKAGSVGLGMFTGYGASCFWKEMGNSFKVIGKSILKK